MFADAIEKAMGYVRPIKTISRMYKSNEVIPAMLEEGLIERMYPDSPRHPYQKYKKNC